MSTQIFSLVLNTLSLFTSVWGLIGATAVHLPPSLAGAGHRQFLTILAVCVTIGNNVINVAAQLRPGPQLSFYSRQLTLPVALVLETVVAVVYWPLRLFALPLIMHNVNDGSRMPLRVSVDCAVHLLPLVYLAVDYLVVERKPFEMSYKKAWVIVTVLGLGYKRYLSVVVDSAAGAVYPYPFLDVQEPYQSAIFVIVTTFAWAVFCSYRKIHTMLHLSLIHI